MLGQIFSFSGYTGRLGYLGVAAIQLLVLGLGFGMMLGTGPKPNAIGLILFLVMMLVSVWVGLAGMVRRIRDMGWPIVLTLIGCFFLPMFSILLLFWPGQPSGPDTSVFSDDDPRPAKAAKTPKDKGESWMDRALAQASQGRTAGESKPAASAAPVPPRFSGAYAAAQGPRTEFGLRR